ncbi:hypothetical protein [Methylohalobius crimeensis]|uniref:hypothetical protein n=1 Tax=Methylohalobius crimeensis TaxID=244365 RepID=UPI00047AFCCE|nr:hypothetical protein [Methylohalobius crimeensis]
MTLPLEIRQRLQFLVRVVNKERRHLLVTFHRLTPVEFTPDQIAELENDPDLAERIDAFVSRFGRLQDTLGDKLLPILLKALGEKTRTVVDNLDRAERLGWIASADEWLEIRRLRNQMIHEYVEDPVVLANALEAARRYVSVLTETTDRMTAELKQRGWTA